MGDFEEATKVAYEQLETKLLEDFKVLQEELKAAEAPDELLGQALLAWCELANRVAKMKLDAIENRLRVHEMEIFLTKKADG